MSGCREFERRMGGDGETAESGWREHLARCSVCRQQAEADALLRQLSPPPPRLGAAFDGRLRRELARRRAERSVPARRAAGMRPSWWALAAYATVATFGSIALLSRLPWESLTVPPALAVLLAAVALLSPLALFDRRGRLRPPG